MFKLSFALNWFVLSLEKLEIWKNRLRKWVGKTWESMQKQPVVETGAVTFRDYM